MRSRLIIAAALYSTVTCLTACSSSDTSSDPPEALLGHWQAHGGGGELLAEQTYNDDGTAIIVDEPGRERPRRVTYVTYVADEREITLDGTGPDDGLTQSFTYFAGVDFLVTWALLPDGETDGPVGTWRGEGQDTSEEGTISRDEKLTIRADGTATSVRVDRLDDGHATTYVNNGRWGISGGKLTLLGPHGGRVLTWDYVPDQVIGARLFERVED